MNIRLNIRLARTVAAAAAMMSLPLASAHAQRLGVLAGGTFSQLHGASDVRAKNRNGTAFGLSLLLPTPGFALQPELLFTNKGSQLDVGGVGTRTVKLDYLEIPMLVRFDAAPHAALNPHLYIGPSVGFNVGCTVTLSGPGVPDSKSDCKRDTFLKPATVDWSGVVGGGVDLSLGGIGLTGGARYGVGLSNINTNTAGDHLRNGTLTVYAGVLFGQR